MPSAMKRQVVVTGIGAVTPLGVGARTLYDRWCAGASGIEDGEGVATEFDPTEHLSVKEARRADRFSQLAMAAGDEALGDAGWNRDELPYDPTRIGCVFGTGIGGIGTLERGKQILLEQGESKVPPLSVPLMMSNAAPGMLAMRYGLLGDTFGTVSACSASAHAIAQATRMIQYGDADAVADRRLGGGADAAVEGGVRRSGRGVVGRDLAAVRCPPRRLRDGRGRGGAGARGRREGRRAGRSRAGHGPRLRRDLGRPPPDRAAPRGRRRGPSDHAPRCATPTWSRRTSTTSTPTAPRRRSTTAPRPRRSKRRSVITPPRCRCRRRNRRSATCWAPRPRSRRRPRSWRCATGSRRRRSAGRSARRAWTSTTCPAKPGPWRSTAVRRSRSSNAFGFGGHNVVLCLEA